MTARYLNLSWAGTGLLFLTVFAAGAQPHGGGAPRPDIPAIPVSDLPPKARQTLALIRAGGPFAHARDGSVFANREGLLPRAQRGTYREYTVMTPGRQDRGARRIVAVKCAGFYYTDHYRSFRRIE